jgi:hypothetical protein
VRQPVVDRPGARGRRLTVEAQHRHHREAACVQSTPNPRQLPAGHSCLVSHGSVMASTSRVGVNKGERLSTAPVGEGWTT